MAIWSLNVTLILESDMTRSEMKNFLQNANMNAITDTLLLDMSLSKKQVESIVRHRETEVGDKPV
jgi:hypothetical protein